MGPLCEVCEYQDGSDRYISSGLYGPSKAALLDEVRACLLFLFFLPRLERLRPRLPLAMIVPEPAP
jgi:hypothetical protein